jgi:hypothetical protein
MSNGTTVATPCFTITGTTVSQQTAPTVNPTGYFGPYQAFIFSTGSFTVNVNTSSSGAVTGLLTVTRF